MFLASNCTCAVYFTYTAHVQLLAKYIAATHVHAICIAFAYVIKQTPYAFVAKIILCMYLLYGGIRHNEDINMHYFQKFIVVSFATTLLETKIWKLVVRALRLTHVHNVVFLVIRTH